jgi:REP element-mobilizing transposase RayT
MWGILRKHNCHLYRIGGVEDHLHIICDLHPSTSLADLVKDLKLASLDFIRREHLFPEFSGWQDGYGAFTYHIDSKEALIEYVKNQEIHHSRGEDFTAEYRRLLQEHKVSFEERYLL